MRACTLKIEYDGAANMAKKILKPNSGLEIPDYQFEALARCLLPKMQKYYESEEGKTDLAQYRVEKEKQAQAGKEGKP